jgi:hypothetical protein
LRWLQVRTEGLIETNWPEVEAVAAALLERGTLKGKEVLAVIQGLSGQGVLNG